MNPFNPLIIRASERGLPDYFSSDEFRQRTKDLAGVPSDPAQANNDRIAIQIHLLGRLALHPKHAETALSDLHRGVVRLDFFGVSNPVPLFEVSREDAQPLIDAVKSNMEGKLYDAAKRVLKWREPRRVSQRDAQERASVDVFRKAQPWTAADPRDLAGVVAASVAAVSMKQQEVRDRRSARLGALSHASGPMTGWTDLLQELASTVLSEDSAVAMIKAPGKSPRP